MAEVKILDVRKLPALAVDRAGKLDRLVMFTVDGGAPLLLRLADEGFTEEKLKAAIQAELKERAGLVGKTLTL